MGNDIKIVALDLDGTTLNNKKEITKRTIEAFERAMNKGVHIVVSTGRTYNSLPRQIFEIPGLEYVITSNGAHITRLKDEERIYENHIDEDAVIKVVAALRNACYSTETFVRGNAYIDEKEFNEIKEKGSMFRDASYVLSTRNPVKGIYDFILSNKGEIENISINFKREEDKEIIENLLSGIENITVTSSFVNNFEIGGATTSKGEALKALMKELDLTEEELMACGDSPNDMEMLKLAAISVAMENGRDDVKEMADFVTACNEEDGVAKAIEKFVLGE